eukprot:1156818-Pelagomonas_calceolata.AAC.2
MQQREARIAPDWGSWLMQCLYSHRIKMVLDQLPTWSIMSQVPPESLSDILLFHGSFMGDRGRHSEIPFFPYFCPLKCTVLPSPVPTTYSHSKRRSARHQAGVWQCWRQRTCPWPPDEQQPKDMSVWRCWRRRACPWPADEQEALGMSEHGGSMLPAWKESQKKVGGS